MAFRIFKRVREMLDVDAGSIADGETLVWDDGTEKFVAGTPAGGAAPTDANYLVGTANGDLSNEIVVGATPGGELGNTWASPTVDATHSGSSHASVQAAAEATAASELATHSADTTGVHGIADTSALALSSGVPSNATFNDHSARHEDGGADEISLTGLSGTPAALTTHEADTTSVHGITDTSALATATDIANHSADTTSVHGITDTSALALTTDVVTKALFDANTVLKADSDNTPAALTMGASTILARLAAGNIVAATPAEMRTLLDVPTNAAAILDALVDAKGDLLVGTAADTVARLAVGATNGQVLEVASGATEGVQWDLPPGHEYDYVERTSNVTISGTTPTLATTVLTGNSVTYTAVPILIEVFCSQLQPAADDNIGIVIYDGSTELGIMGLHSSVGSTTTTDQIILPFYGVWRITPSAGSHQYGVRAYRTTANGTIVSGSGAASNAMPSFIRVTKA